MNISRIYDLRSKGCGEIFEFEMKKTIEDFKYEILGTLFEEY